ncbi:hypothetical protein EK21DRAFT_57555 [Setomelanomma holmii]|uniref:Xylanolytic transcriptional activator regulatory domain-containing protein n=1 Tax=Setomelanomma holmii TaxID=210430 RepID=A0A9P4HFG9_9PLEO|nr:hypothetical protein EK21DRAFT_57555 [Setomelanomma holmii]
MFPFSNHDRNEPQSDFTQLRRLGVVSRVPSPPNEASQEDHIPFAWNPRSAPVAMAKPDVLLNDDPIFGLIEGDLQLSAETGHRSPDSFTIPSLPLVNVFISLFFRRFLPQAPVLHRSSIDINALPGPVLAIIMVVGSTYSCLRHTRRFGIILFDRIRQNLLALIEADNSLMREPLIIYALALTCFMGLWCGNKRAFELAEALRASVVTYTRRLPANQNDLHQGHQSASYTIASSTPTSDRDKPLQARWSRWTAVKGRKRLCWLVYSLDSQFFSILGMPGMMTLAEIRRWNCPCDESYWIAPTPRAWKTLLGSASEPPCPIYGQMVASLLPAMKQAPEGIEGRFLPRTSNWNSKLLLLAIMAEVFHFEQTSVVVRMGFEQLDGDEYSTQAESLAAQTYATAAVHLWNTLQIWHEVYACDYHSPRSDPTSAYFGRTAMIIFHLARLYLQIPLSDIQDCLGRSGSTDARIAMARLSAWVARDHEQTYEVVESAARCIAFIMANGDETAPYDVIGLFLSHVAIWAIAKATTNLQRVEISKRLQQNGKISVEVCEFVEAGFVAPTPNGSAGDPQLILKHAIQVRVRLGTWGTSSNLALLLHHTVTST